MPVPLQLINAAVTDIPVIRNIAMATWPAAYGSILSAGQIGYMLHMMYSEGALRLQMQGGEHQFIIAYQNEQAIAFAGFGQVKKEPIVYKLHKLYVLPNIQKSGAGKMLLDQVETIAKAAGAVQLVLNVNRSNNAKDFYLHHGFTVLEDADLDIGQGFLMVDHVMGKVFDP